MSSSLTLAVTLPGRCGGSCSKGHPASAHVVCRFGLTGDPLVVQVQLAQLQQQSLAAQVAQMRAQAKLNPGANVGKGAPQLCSVPVLTYVSRLSESTCCVYMQLACRSSLFSC